MLDDFVKAIEIFKDDVVGTYAYLFNKLAKLLENVDFKNLKQNCTSRTAGYPEDFRKKMEAAEQLKDILAILEEPSYCNWLNIRLLKRIVMLTEISLAQRLIKAYEESLHSRKVLDVTPYFRLMFFDQNQFSKVEAKINKNVEKITVLDVIDFCQKLESDLKLPEGSFVTAGCNTGCFKINCVIPAQCAFYVNETVKKSILKFRKLHVQYLEIESFKRHFCCKFTGSSLSLSAQCEDKYIHIFTVYVYYIYEPLLVKWYEIW